MHLQRPLLATLPLLAALSTATGAAPAGAADPESRVKGKLRLHLDTDFFGWTHGREFNDPDADLPPHEIIKVNRVGFGFARPLQGDSSSVVASDLDSVLYSAGSSMFGLGLGYGVTKHLIVGARMGLSFDHLSSPNDNDADTKSTFNYFSTVFTPYLEVLPLTTGRVLPFILFRTGFSAGALGYREHGTSPLTGDYSTLSRSSTIAPTVGLGGGAHFFITDAFSFDASLMFDYRWYFSKSLSRDSETDVTDETDWRRTWQSFTLGAVVGFSVWFL